MTDTKPSDKGLFERIALLDNPTPADQQIADFFASDYPNLAFRDLASMCEGAGVSTASITRFVRKLGYENFRDFSNALRTEVATSFDRPLQRSSTAQIPQEPGFELEQQFSLALEDIQQTLALYSREDFIAISKLLADQSRPVYLASFATGRTLINYFALMLKYQRPDVNLISAPDMTAHDLVDITDNSLLLATSFDRHPKLTYRILQFTKKRGGTTILLSNRPTTPLRRYADHFLLINSSASARFKSRATLLLTLESLLYAVETLNSDTSTERTQLLESVNDELDLFIHPTDFETA
ncbi:MurR/RpiR family transcriptional regulator [Gleimia hominis]|uniref:MurR/RpiR family transcriptional regulator n=1 Tax=Gleimia hominis TaxID=595468 RepID=UPI000C7FD899|nr:MurR/RpiR family transcriptional regulator [Gleimia hominis]WIK64179.1 MurR/RpiR family transcriptional regulator [Gleimia hominis]